jgi:ankyrin repeat protein
LLEHDRIDPNQATPDGRTALVIAAQSGQVEVVRALLAHQKGMLPDNQTIKILLEVGSVSPAIGTLLLAKYLHEITLRGEDHHRRTFLGIPLRYSAGKKSRAAFALSLMVKLGRIDVQGLIKHKKALSSGRLATIFEICKRGLRTSRGAPGPSTE